MMRNVSHLRLCLWYAREKPRVKFRLSGEVSPVPLDLKTIRTSENVGVRKQTDKRND